MIDRGLDEANWEPIGEVGVDSGTLWVGDPAYVAAKNGEEVNGDNPLGDWMEFCAAILKEKIDEQGVAVFPTTGIAVSNFGGDGTFPVYAIRGSGGRIRAVMIDLDGIMADPADSDWASVMDGDDDDDGDDA